MKTRIPITCLVVLMVGTLLLVDSALAGNYTWVAAQQGSCETTCRNTGQTPVYAGFDGVFNTQMYVCGVDAKMFQKGRDRSSGYVPGKNIIQTGSCNVPFKGKEFTQRVFTCLCLQ